MRAAERSKTAASNIVMPGQSSQSLLCIHQTTPSTNQPYKTRETILLRRQAGDAVSESIKSSTVHAPLTLRTLAYSTARAGIWLICKQTCPTNHHRRGRPHLPHRLQCCDKKIPQARAAAKLPTMLNSDVNSKNHVATAGLRRTTSTRWSPLS